MAENPLFDKMYNHYLHGVKNFQSFSRLERFEYAYTALQTVRDLYCSQNNVDPQKIDIAFARMPNSNGQNIWKKVENNVVLETTVALDIFEALRSNTTPDSLFSIISHEMGHAIDCLTRKDFTTQHHQLRALNIDTYSGVGWWGRKDERIANDFAHQNMLSILDRQIAENPQDQTLLAKRETLIGQYKEKSTMHKKAESELEKLIAKKQKEIQTNPSVIELPQKLPQSQDKNQTQTQPQDRLVPPQIRNGKYVVDRIIDREKSQTCSTYDNGPLFISIDTIREVAEDPQLAPLLNQQDYTKIEEGAMVSINSTPGQESITITNPTSQVQPDTTQVQTDDTQVQPDAAQTAGADNFDLANMTMDALRDLGEVIKIQSGSEASMPAPETQMAPTMPPPIE